MIWVKHWLTAVIFIFVVAPASQAHHLWVEEKDGVYTVCRGIMPNRIDAYDPICVKGINAFGKDGNPVTVERQNENLKTFFRSDKDISLVAVWCDWGHRVNTTQGKKLMTKREAQTAGFRVIDSFLSTQFSKSLFCSGDPATKKVGLKFEIIPLKNPFDKAIRDQLPVQLIFAGKPLADIAVFSEKGDEIITDKDGIAKIPVIKNGIQLIWAIHRMAAKGNSELDYQVFTTFLAFEVKR